MVVEIWPLPSIGHKRANTAFQAAGGVRMPSPVQDGHKRAYNAKQGVGLGALRCKSSNRVMRLV